MKQGMKYVWMSLGISIAIHILLTTVMSCRRRIKEYIEEEDDD